MKILSRPRGNAEEYGRWSVNPYLGCPHQCHYCVSPDTLVFMADGSSKRIDDVQVGDEIYGVEKQPTNHYAVARAKVTAKAETMKKPYRLTFSNGQQIVCSGDHRFLTHRGWKYTSGTERGKYRRPFLTENDRMVCIPIYPTIEFDVTDDYRRGYLSGIIRGDANLAEYHYDDKGSQYHFRLALKEPEAVERTSDYLAHFGIEVREFDFPMVDRKTKETVSHKAIRKSGVCNYEKIRSLVEWNTDNREWLRGFMAGIYDAEGCKGDAKRMSNSNQQIINAYCLALESFGLDYTFDKPRRKGCGKLVQQVRLKGGLLASLQFLRTCRPAIMSLFDFEGARLKFTGNAVGLVEKKKLTNPTRLIDIETTTGNFFANGIVAHNCYLKKGPGAKVLGGDKPTLKAGVVSEEHAYHLAMAEILENREQIIRDGGLFMTFTSDPCLKDTGGLFFAIASQCVHLNVPVTMLTKCNDFVDYLMGQECEAAADDFGSGNESEIQIAVGWTLTGHDELESNATSNSKRIEEMKLVSKYKIFGKIVPWASIEPVITFDASLRMIEQALEAGCRHFKIGLMTERTRVCRKGFSLGGHDFAPYDRAECCQFVEYVMALTGRYGATVYWKQSFVDFLEGPSKKDPQPVHGMTAREFLSQWPHSVGKDWSMFQQ